MMTIRTFRSAAFCCGAVLFLSGCHHQETGANGKPFPATQAAPPPQTQVQNIENDPHIPPAQKAAFEAQLKNGNATRIEKTPANAH